MLAMMLPLKNEFDPAPIESFVAVLTCPACDASGARPIGRPAPGWDIEVVDRVFRHPNYDVKYCASCGVYFKSRVFSEQALAEYYRLLPFESFESSELFPTDRLVLSAIAAVEAGAKVLDFGCGVGRVLERLTARHQCYGVEVNERAREIAKAKGITVVPESSVRSRTERDFDFIILSDVFEHVAKPLQLLRILTDVLKPGGSLIISTGNGDAVRCREFISHFWYFRAPGHLHMLSPKHLRWCAAGLGLDLNEYTLTSHYATPFLPKCRQHVAAWAFEQFHLRPRSWSTQLLRVLPKIRRAENWPLAPAITCTPDHLVAVLRKP